MNRDLDDKNAVGDDGIDMQRMEEETSKMNDSKEEVDGGKLLLNWVVESLLNLVGGVGFTVYHKSVREASNSSWRHDCIY